MKKVFAFLLFSISLEAFSATINLEKWVADIGKITGKTYVYSIKLEEKINSSEDVVIESENGDKFLSYLLFQNDYTRIPLTNNTYSIINSRDVRYNVLPEFQASAKKVPDLSDTYDYQNMVYTTRSSIFTSPLTRALRPFMSKYGRVLESSEAKKLIIQDTAINLKRIYSYIKDLDVEPTKEIIRAYEKKNRELAGLKRIEAKSCKDYISQLEIMRNSRNEPQASEK